MYVCVMGVVLRRGYMDMLCLLNIFYILFYYIMYYIHIYVVSIKCYLSYMRFDFCVVVETRYVGVLCMWGGGGTSGRVRSCVHVCRYVYVRDCTCVRMSVCMYISVCMCVCMCLYVCIFPCMYACAPVSACLCPCDAL
eukprot:GHVQ01020895.1.p1 GENE.GHVQ01020895.1~~GHVQ01020895.1.p1  ORF type:complete len:138 (-),score=3.94 GHVQ01020895.1:637-1050(-)